MPVRNQMPKDKAASTRVTPGEAQYVLDRLLRERRVNAGEVGRLVREMHSEIEELEWRLAALRMAAGSGGSPRGTETSSNKRQSFASGRGRNRQVTPELARSRRLQGEYMGLIRHVQGPARTRIKRIASDQGREVAIKAMRATLAK